MKTWSGRVGILPVIGGSARVMDSGPMDISEWRSSSVLLTLFNVIWDKVNKT